MCKQYVAIGVHTTAELTPHNLAQYNRPYEWEPTNQHPLTFLIPCPAVVPGRHTPPRPQRLNGLRSTAQLRL